MVKQFRIRVYGKVQGVFFRDSARGKAEMFGLTGRAKNMPDGSVEIVAQGSPENIEKFVSWCRQGPPPARVERVEVTEEEPEGEYTTFDIRW